MKKCYLYFAKSKNDDTVTFEKYPDKVYKIYKIGTSIHPEQRVSGYDAPLSMEIMEIAKFPNDAVAQVAETFLKKWFYPQQSITNRGRNGISDWFGFDDEQADDILHHVRLFAEDEDYRDGFIRDAKVIRGELKALDGKTRCLRELYASDNYSYPLKARINLHVEGKMA